MHDIFKVFKGRNFQLRIFYLARLLLRIKRERDFPGGAVVKNLPANAGDTGSSPGPGRSHVPWSN